MSEFQLKAEQRLRELIRRSYFVMNEVENKEKAEPIPMKVDIGKEE